MTKLGPQIGRLAIRVEGDNWNAYYTMPGTMEGAIYLGSIKMQFVQDEGRKKIFMDLMREAVGDLIEDETGVRPIWGGPKTAPESERSGNG
jgi:hypothetical protein